MRWLLIVAAIALGGCENEPTAKASAKKEPSKMTTRVKDCKDKGEQIQVEQRVVIDNLDNLDKSLDRLEEKLKKEKKNGR